jgi:aminopeptidase N
MKLAPWVFLAAAGAGGSFLTADTYPRQAGVDAQHYVFRIALHDDSDEISGEATADLLFTRDGVTEFSLDLASAANGGGMTVTKVTGSGGEALPFTHRANRLVVQLAAPSKAGERGQFTVSYHGTPAILRPPAGLVISPDKYKERTFFSLNWPDRAREWLPIIDHPYDKATSEFLVTAPARYGVVANGLLQEETDLGDGRRLTHWKQSVPIASWLNAIGVDQFATHFAGTVRGVPLQTWVHHQDRENGVAGFEEPARKALEFYIDRIGPYPYEKLANVEAPGLSGATEYASVIFYGETSMPNRAASSLVAHEVAHQWFGDSVTEKDWDDAWLSEGFATYFALLFTEHYEGRDAFVAGLKRARDTVFRAEKQFPNDAVIHDNLADPNQAVNQLVSQKGAWALHMLRGQLGTERFWTGIREYYRRFRDANASTEDFRKVMEGVAGADLGWFFTQWLRRPGSPVVDGTWRYNPATKKVELSLAQTQGGDAYRLPMEVSLAPAGAGPAKLDRIEMSDRQQRFDLVAAEEPASVTLDPNSWLLMDARLVKK